MNSKVIKFVAGGGKTTESIEYLENQRNGLYLAFTNSVVSDVAKKGYLSKTVDSLFVGFIIPKFTSIVPLITTGAKVNFFESDKLPIYLRGAASIKINQDGIICNKTKLTSISMNTDNLELYKMGNITNGDNIKFIFGKSSLNLCEQLRAEISSYLINHYPNEIIELLGSRFSYIIVDEAQDLKGYREDFAKLLFDSRINLIVLGDDNQNINGGGKWFEELEHDEYKDKSYRCPEELCKWIRESLTIDIYGNEDKGSYNKIEFVDVPNLDDGKRYLLYKGKIKKYKDLIDNWNGPKETIQKAKGRTIYEDVVILGESLNKKYLYTAVTRTKKNAYSTITKINL